MFRALAVISASAWLALAPAALAVTHPSSHKHAHAKQGGADEANMKAKLRRAAEADEPAGLVRTSAHGKASKHHREAVEAPDDAAPAHASKTSRRHGKAVADEEAAPSKSRARSKSKHHLADAEAPDEAKVSSKRRGHAADEEADAAPSKSRSRSKSKHHLADEEAPDETKVASKRHGHAADEEADAASSKSRSRSKHHAAADEESADATETKASSRRHGRAEADEAGPVEHVSLKSARSCVAAHIRAHGRPRGSRARAALQRECVKEVEAARRKAEEEAMIRNWSAPRGPLIYPGALPHGQAANAVSEPPPAAAESPVPSTTAAADAPAAETPGAPAAAAGAAAPAKGAATVEQKPAPSAQTSFLRSLWSRVRRGPQRAPGSPAPTLAGLLGSDETRLKAELGEPELMRAEGDGALWTYKLPGCALYVFLGRETAGGAWTVKGAQSGPLKRGGTAPDVDACLKDGRS